MNRMDGYLQYDLAWSFPLGASDLVYVLWQQAYNVCLLSQIQPDVWLLLGSEVIYPVEKC